MLTRRGELAWGISARGDGAAAAESGRRGGILELRARLAGDRWPWRRGQSKKKLSIGIWRGNFTAFSPCEEAAWQMKRRRKAVTFWRSDAQKSKRHGKSTRRHRGENMHKRMCAHHGHEESAHYRELFIIAAFADEFRYDKSWRREEIIILAVWREVNGRRAFEMRASREAAAAAGRFKEIQSARRARRP